MASNPETNLFEVSLDRSRPQSAPVLPEEETRTDAFDPVKTALDATDGLTRRDRKKMKKLQEQNQKESEVVDGLLGDYFCKVCERNCFTAKNLASHLLGVMHKKKLAESSNKAKGTTRLLERFPMRGSTLDHKVFVADLDTELQELVYTYVKTSCVGSPELVEFTKEVVRLYPKYLRVKELFETLEAYVRLGKAVVELRGRIDTVYDFACGHGLLGVLFAYRFPALAVKCVDLEKRVAFDHYVEVLQKVGVQHPDEEGRGIVSNLSYIESDFNLIEIDERSFVVCIHGCNEVTSGSMDKVASANAAYGMIPCCIRDTLYTTHRMKHLKNDDTRYAIMIGMIAERYRCHRITAIDRQITNRHLVLIGPSSKFPEKPTAPGESS